MPSITTRRATVDDVGFLIENVQAGFDSYVGFAPLGWVPPEMDAERARSVEILGHADTWALLALVGGGPVGHIAFTPARAGEADSWASRPLIPRLAHLWQLFVLPPWWGRRVAPLLHDAAIAELRTREYDAVRLYTPSLHARARRFYERHGWHAAGEKWNEHLELMLTEYRLALD